MTSVSRGLSSLCTRQYHKLIERESCIDYLYCSNKLEKQQSYRYHRLAELKSEFGHCSNLPLLLTYLCIRKWFCPQILITYSFYLQLCFECWTDNDPYSIACLFYASVFIWTEHNFNSGCFFFIIIFFYVIRNSIFLHTISNKCTWF